MRLLLCFVSLTMLTGCVYNDAPIHLYMHDHEMSRAVNEHFDPGMPPARVKATLESFEVRYRTYPAFTAEPAEIEAEIWKAGPRLSFSCCPGSMRFLFTDDALETILFRHPLPDDSGLLAPAQQILLEQPLELEGSGGDAP